MAKKPAKLKSAAAQGVLQSREEVVAGIATIGRLVRERTRIETRMNDELAGIKAQFEGLAAPIAKEIEDLTRGIQAWCEAHRDELTGGGKTKTASLETGEVKWRTTPPSVQIKGTDAVLALLAQRGLDRFIRTKAEPNKEAMLNEPDVAGTVPGVTIKQSEEFIVEPFQAELAEAV
jgi:phage host-nuclease inhibitor protein Gam